MRIKILGSCFSILSLQVDTDASGTRLSINQFYSPCKKKSFIKQSRYWLLVYQVHTKVVCGLTAVRRTCIPMSGEIGIHWIVIVNHKMNKNCHFSLISFGNIYIYKEVWWIKTTINHNGYFPLMTWLPSNTNSNCPLYGWDHLLKRCMLDKTVSFHNNYYILDLDCMSGWSWACAGYYCRFFSMYKYTSWGVLLKNDHCVTCHTLVTAIKLVTIRNLESKCHTGVFFFFWKTYARALILIHHTCVERSLRSHE